MIYDLGTCEMLIMNGHQIHNFPLLAQLFGIDSVSIPVISETITTSGATETIIKLSHSKNPVEKNYYGNSDNADATRSWNHDKHNDSACHHNNHHHDDDGMTVAA